MDQEEKKTINYYLRAVHRDLGYFALGLMIIYSISGIVLVYRDTNFLKKTNTIEKQLSPDLEPYDLGQALLFRNFNVTKTEGETLFFQNGSYNKTTGIAVYTTSSVMFPFNKFIELHKSASSNPLHHFNNLVGGMLLVLALSSFWMFKTGTKFFKRGIYFAIAGIVFTILILLI